LAIYLLMTLIPLIDPLKKNYSKFVFPYFLLRTVFVEFLVLLNLFVLIAGFDSGFPINYFILPLFFILFAVLGLFLPLVKRNYFVGIKTPWTIHSEQVWDKTHKLAG